MAEEIHKVPLFSYLIRIHSHSLSRHCTLVDDYSILEMEITKTTVNFGYPCQMKGANQPELYP